MPPKGQRRTNASAGLLADKKERARTFTKRLPSLVGKCSMLSRLTGARIVVMVHKKGEENRPSSFVWYSSKCKGNNFMKQCDKMAERACRPDTKIQGCTNADYDTVFHKPAGGRWENIDTLPTSWALSPPRNAALKQLLDERRPVDLPSLSMFSGGFYHPAVRERREVRDHGMFASSSSSPLGGDYGLEIVPGPDDAAAEQQQLPPPPTPTPTARRFQRRDRPTPLEQDWASLLSRVDHTMERAPGGLNARDWTSAAPMPDRFHGRNHLWHTIKTRLWQE